MGKKKIHFKDIKTEKEILKICYSLWKLSLDEYKTNKLDSNTSSIISEAMKYRWYHCRLTGTISLEVYDKLHANRKDKWKILYFAALLHDIKKFDHKHSKVGAIFIKNNIKNVMDIDESDMEVIINLVRYHKSSCNNEDLLKEMNSEMINILKILKVADSESKKREKEDSLKENNILIKQ